MEHEEMVQKITALEGSMKTAFNKIADNESDIKELRCDYKILNEMSANIRVLANNTENLSNEVKDVKAEVKDLKEKPNADIATLKTDVKELKEKPAKQWDALTAVIITAIATGLITFAITKVLGG
ncbi:MAG: hypothetical protein Q8876_08055 [Bacillota bacterium]|nr:hypothetical protein [Bacillota bacterium]